ncbi:hypothetical protein BJ875DRAFT_489394 [Amylocarpus encephaloides]|uniref:Uncharacterized protein n=1 Tax=Amylocarpus encephaloides TaxID=45428 RepID=A0A9P7Y7S2_9HELO|nr:hypothetical protein BJ875DRAFT_489394 [Amylocarpus encephaloides]
MAYHRGRSFSIPGLNKALKAQDLEESRNIYNILPTDSQQPEILESHIHNLATIFVRNRAEKILGIHLAHAHFAAPEQTAILGVNYDQPYCRWARPTVIQNVDLNNVHGHIFVLTDHGFHPYEYQSGAVPDLSGLDNAFFPDLADYLNENNLSMLVGLQVIDPNPAHMLELVLPQGTVMLDISDLKGCVPTRQTGWKFESEDSEPRVCQANETHGQTAIGHEIYNKGDPHPRLETFQDLKHALVEAEILCV